MPTARLPMYHFTSPDPKDSSRFANGGNNRAISRKCFIWNCLHNHVQVWNANCATSRACPGSSSPARMLTWGCFRQPGDLSSYWFERPSVVALSSNSGQVTVLLGRKNIFLISRKIDELKEDIRIYA